MASSSSADPTPTPRRPRRRLIAAAAGLALLIAVAVTTVLVTRSGGDETPRHRAADGSFSVAVPTGWKALTDRQLDDIPTTPAAVLRRQDRRGLVVIRRQPALKRSSRPLTEDLTRQLKQRFSGLEPVGARTIQLRTGPAYVYTFARPKTGTVQSIAVTAMKDRTYTLDAVTGASARDVAAQIGDIVRSFDASAPDSTSSS
jgi:hypothetical protein